MNKDWEDALNEASNSLKKNPKNPKGSARAKFNRRRLWLAHALEQMDCAIQELLSQAGTVYKRQEVDTLAEAIKAFRETTGLRTPEAEPLTGEQLDGFMDMLENLQPWEPPSKEELAKLYASLDLPFDEGSSED